MSTHVPKRRKRAAPQPAEPQQINLARQRLRLAPFQVRLEPTLIERINKFARAEQISASAYVRRILINHVPGG